jgi:hypothetical protein
LTKVKRTIIADGTWAIVSCSVREDGSEPGGDFLNRLQEQMWPMPDIPLPDEAQARYLVKMLSDLEDISNGIDVDLASHNRLEDGIWELKRDVLRLTFYDTPGDGTYSPKHGCKAEEFDGKLIRWLVSEDLDEHVRIGHAFTKVSPRTLRQDIDEATCIREEDLRHDKTNQAVELTREG